MSRLVAWFGAFLFTQAVEIPVYVLALRADRGKEFPLGKAVGLGFVATLITHPFVWFAFPSLRASMGWGYWTYVLIAELFAVGVEAAYFRALRLPKPLAWAVVANGASAGLGLASRYAFGWP